MKVYLNKLVSSLLIFLLITITTVSHAKDGAIIVFDASGSMWGQIKGKTKIEIARDVMGTLVKDWNEDIELGLIAYGHREKGNCNDIEVLQKVSTVDSDKILQTINKISPKGKTPISQSLKKAAETLRYTEDSATVILISDGEETCKADPCVVSKELEAKGINFTAHVIGFDIKKNKKAREQLKCIAENTGGQFYEAEDASSLKKALVKVKKAVVDPRPTLCKTYAENAIKHERTNIEKECSFKGKFWTMEYNTHFDWCMEQEIGSVAPNKEKQARIDDLKKCQTSKMKVEKSCKKFERELLPKLLSKSHDYYNKTSNKALVVARHEDGCYTFGWSAGRENEKQAVKKAFQKCEKYKAKKNKVGTCELYLKNNMIVSSDLKQTPEKIKTVVVKTKIGSLQLINNKEMWVKVFDQKTGKKRGNFGQFKDTVLRLPAGTYKLKFEDYEINDIEVSANKKNVVDVSKLVGWLALSNNKEMWVKVFDQKTRKKKGNFGQFKNTVLQLPVGTYKLKFEDYEINDIKVSANKKNVLDVSKLVGWLALSNNKEMWVKVFDQKTGKKKGNFGQFKNTVLQLPVGTYKLKFENYEINDIVIEAGQKLVVKVGG